MDQYLMLIAFGPGTQRPRRGEAGARAEDRFYRAQERWGWTTLAPRPPGARIRDVIARL